MRLELVRVHRQREQVGNAIRAQPRLEEAWVMDERIQHREPAGAAALDHQFVRVRQAQRHHGLRAFHHILHIQRPPAVAQRLAVRAPKAGAAAVVDLQESIAAAGEKQPVQAKAHRSLRSRSTMHAHD